MENQYLPILHENISLSVLRVSNEPLASRDEWVVKMLFNVNSRKPLPYRRGASLLQFFQSPVNLIMIDIEN
jgi:hypothetical protein